MYALPVWDVAQWTLCPFGTSHSGRIARLGRRTSQAVRFASLGRQAMTAGGVGFLVSCTRVEFLSTVLYEHGFCLVLLDAYIFSSFHYGSTKYNKMHKGRFVDALPVWDVAHHRRYALSVWDVRL